MVKIPKSFQWIILIYSFSFFSVYQVVEAQSITDTWDIPSYQKEDYTEFYAYQYFSTSLEDWNFKVEEMLAESVNSWIQEANFQMETILANETSFDFLISNEGYLDERRRSLLSEISIFYTAWERELIGDYFENRDAFLLKLETGKIDQMYLERIGKESIYEEYSKEELLQLETREKILQSAIEWEYQWEQSKQEGLDSFSNSLAMLHEDYEAYLLKLEETEDRFQTNLSAISEYKETVKGVVSQMVLQLKEGLETSCEYETGCQYRNFDGSFNEAGKVLSKLIHELTEELISSKDNPDSFLSIISEKMQNFLANETNDALLEQSYYQNRIYTYQTGLNVNLEQTKSNFDLGLADWILRTQIYHALSADQKYENWTIEADGNIGSFSKIHDPFLKAIFQSIHHSDSNRLVDLINGKLGPGRRVSSLIGSNLYTDAYHFINNDQFLGIPIVFDSASHVNGNLLLDGKFYYAFWKMERTTPVFPSGTFERQMGAIGYSVLYEMFDETSSQTANYWSGNHSQLNAQNSHFQNNLIPAIGSWESKVKQYADDYLSWKDVKKNLQDEAKTNLIANLHRLETSKEEWLSQLETEHVEGQASWNQFASETNAKSSQISSPSFPKAFSYESFQTTKLEEYEKLSDFQEKNGVLIGGNNFLTEISKTITGVNQYATILQMNHDLESLQRKEQTKLLNQMVYTINPEITSIRTLTKEEKILVGQYDVQSLTKEEQKNFGLCYEYPNASHCSGLLKKEYQLQYDTKNQTVSIGKEIYDGQLGGKNTEGEYSASKVQTSRHFQLSQIGKIQTSDRKDFFTEWSEDDWKSVYGKQTELSQEFLTKSLAKDQLTTASNIQSIELQNQRNAELFFAKKEKQENQDSFLQEIVIAYLSGGSQGIKASMKSKIESAVNSELAKVWVEASGGNPADIQKLTMAIEFMRGRIKTKKIEARDNFVSIHNPMGAIENILGKTVSHSMQFLDHSTGGIGTIPINLAVGGIMALTKQVAGEKRYEAIKQQISGRKQEIANIKENEVQLAKSAMSQEVASSTGISLDIVSKFLEDQYSQNKTRTAKKKQSSNFISDFQSKSIGSFGGMMKTALVATGITESELSGLLKDSNQIIHAKNLNPNSNSQTYFNHTEQAFGLQTSGTQFQSAFLDYTDGKTLVTELGKQALAKELAKISGLEESFLNQSIDISYGNLQRDKANQKAKAKAARQTVINAVSLVITMGASGALSGVGSVLSSIGKAANYLTQGILPATMKMGQIVSSTMVQTMAGSHEGPKGAIAGFANGVLGGMIGEQSKFQSGFLKGLVPGIGVKYSEKEGWGGTIGIGNNNNHLSFSVSEKGNSSLQLSKSIAEGLQVTTDFQTNDVWNLGLQYNPKGEGPRKDWNYSMMYDLKGSGLSGSIGYTDPNSQIGLSTNWNQDGFSLSSELHGVSMGTLGANGFQMDDYQFANQNINMAQEISETNESKIISSEGEGSASELFGQLSMLGGLVFGGIGLINFLRNRSDLGSNQMYFDDPVSFPNQMEASSDRSFFGRVTDSVKNGVFQFGESLNRYADAHDYRKTPNSDGKTNAVNTSLETDRISKLKTSIIDDYSKDSRLDTEKKLYELKLAGVDTSEIEATIKAKRGGKDVPMSKSVEKSLNEYKRLRESRAIQPIGNEAVNYLSSENALANVKLEFDPKKETKEAYFQRLGDEVCAATKDVDLSTDELVALHSANVAKLLGENLKDKINYARHKIIDGVENVSAVNTVDENGFRQTYETDCIRYIGAVLYAAGLTDKGSFANLNTDVFLTPEEMDRMKVEFKAGHVHYNGVEYFRQAGGFSNLVSERLTTEDDLKAHKAKGVIPELKIGTIGITRKMEAPDGVSKKTMKSDHIYIVIGKKFNAELGVNQYLISESAGGSGVQNRWIMVETKAQINDKLEVKYRKEGIEEKKAKKMIEKQINKLEFSDYLLRSEFHELKPQIRE